MTSLSPSVAPDSFTWSRVWSIMRLICPRVRNLTILYIAVCVAVAVLCVLAHLAGVPAGSVSIIVVIPTLMFYAAPAFVVNAVGSVQFQQIPATIAEKFVAITIYSLVINYFINAISSVTATITTLDNAEIQSILTMMQTSCGGWAVALNWLSGLLAPIVCMYVAIANPGHKWKAVGASILVCVAEGFAGGVYGIVMTYKSFAACGREPDVDTLVLDIVGGMAPFVYVMLAVCVLLGILFMILAYRKLASRQL